MDIISSLPDVVIESILEKLPLVDQVRTSILSTGWRHRWARISSLAIDRNFYDFLSTSKPILKKGTSKTILRKGTSNSKLLRDGDYLNVINSLLVQHIGHLRVFSLFIPLDGLKSGYHLPVQYVLRNGTENFSLINGNHNECFVLPLFTVVGLKSLTLQRCELRLPPAFHGFSNLTWFGQLCHTGRGDTFFSLISSCPALEVVVVHGFNYHDRALNFVSPRLRHLSLGGEFKSISLRSPQTMETFGLLYTGSNISSVDLDVLHSMTNLKHLTLGRFTHKILAKCTDLPRLGQMNKLSLRDLGLHDIDVLNCILRLFTSSQNLKELDIEMLITSFKAYDNPECLSVIKCYENHEFGKLSRVRLIGIRGLRTEMDLIELLLCRSPLLELMSIIVFGDIGTSVKKHTIAEDVAGFYRLSPNAKIQF